MVERQGHGGLSGRKVVVTAGAGGLGAVTAETFAKAGAAVFVCDVDETALSAIEKHDNIEGMAADVGNPDAVTRFMTAALDHLGGIDVLVNNAGIGGVTAAAEETSVADWDRTMAVNASGPFYCARLAIPAMKAAGRGAIVNISSTSARTGLPLRVAYAVSKVAVLGLTHTLARELGPHGITVNAVLPGAMDNERLRRVGRAKAEANGVSMEEAMGEFVEFVSMRTLIDMQDVADMVAYLASPAARHISGQNIGVCGNAEFER